MFSQNDVLFARNVLTDKVLSGWYGVDIMLDYLDYIGGNSAELMEIADVIGIKISVEFGGCLNCTLKTHFPYFTRVTGKKLTYRG